MLGILLVATGHPYYGRLAYNLALTIKAAEDIPIAVVYDGTSLSHLNINQLSVFDNKIKLPNDYRTGFGVKLHLDQLTPFDKTLFLDVDMLWLAWKPSHLFERLKGKSFACISEGDSDNPNNRYYFWADQEEIKKAYKVEKVHQLRSEVIYFEKTDVFEKARRLNPEKKLKTIRRFGSQIPDELYFNIATADSEPSLGFMPAYWSRLNKDIIPALAALNNQYYLLSFGSNAMNPGLKKIYDQIMRVCCHRLRLPYLFNLKSKKEWAPGRQKI